MAQPSLPSRHRHGRVTSSVISRNAESGLVTDGQHDGMCALFEVGFVRNMELPLGTPGRHRLLTASICFDIAIETEGLMLSKALKISLSCSYILYVWRIASNELRNHCIGSV